jgi:hypothetical protein
LDISVGISGVSSVLAFILAFHSYQAFKYSKKEYLLNFSGGFLLLALSYFILIPIALGISNLSVRFGDTDDIANFPIIALMQTVGYGLIVLAYSQTVRARKILAYLMILLVLIATLTLFSKSFIPANVDVAIYILNTCLLSFVLYHMLKVMPPTDLVFAGFLTLAINEYTLLIGSINESLYSYPDEGTFLIAEVLRFIGLCMLVVAFLNTRRYTIRARLVGGIETA